MAEPSQERKGRRGGEGSAGPPRARRRAGEAAVTSHQLTVASGNRAAQAKSRRAGVTSDEAENAPQLRVCFGEGSRGARTTSEAPSQDTRRQAQHSPPP